MAVKRSLPSARPVENSRLPFQVRIRPKFAASRKANVRPEYEIYLEGEGDDDGDDDGDGVEWGEFVANVSTSQTRRAPGGLSATAVTAESVTLRWNSDACAVDYVVATFLNTGETLLVYEKINEFEYDYRFLLRPSYLRRNAVLSSERWHRGSRKFEISRCWRECGRRGRLRTPSC